MKKVHWDKKPVMNIFLLIFFSSLLFAGAEKGRLIIEDKLSFQEIMQNISPYLTVFTIAGIIISIGLLLITIPLLKVIVKYLKN